MHGMRIKSHKNQHFSPTVQQPNGRTVNLPKTFWQGLQPVPNQTQTEPQSMNTPAVSSNHPATTTHTGHGTKPKKSHKTKKK